jgi:hypothetical protein
MSDSYDGSYMLEVPFPCMINEKGLIFVGHQVRCINCKTIYDAYLNMSKLNGFYIEGFTCIVCDKKQIELITYEQCE